MRVSRVIVSVIIIAEVLGGRLVYKAEVTKVDNTNSREGTSSRESTNTGTNTNTGNNTNSSTNTGNNSNTGNNNTISSNAPSGADLLLESHALALDYINQELSTFKYSLPVNNIHSSSGSNSWYNNLLRNPNSSKTGRKQREQIEKLVEKLNIIKQDVEEIKGDNSNNIVYLENVALISVLEGEIEDLRKKIEGGV